MLGSGVTPSIGARAKSMTPLAYVALGSNLSGPLAQLRQARQGLDTLGQVVRCSSLWRTTPVGGPVGQDDFLNAVAVLRPQTDDPEMFLAQLLQLEADQGRTRKVRHDARTLDLDLLGWDERVLETPNLTLPHPRLLTRTFVLAPLCEVAPAWRHPITGQRACEVLRTLPPGGIEKTMLGW